MAGNGNGGWVGVSNLGCFMADQGYWISLFSCILKKKGRAKTKWQWPDQVIDISEWGWSSDLKFCIEAWGHFT